MKIRLVCIGKPNQSELKTLFEDFKSRILKYVNFEVVFCPIKVKGSNTKIDLQQKEMEAILKYKTTSTALVLLDENGKTMTSVEFSTFLQNLHEPTVYYSLLFIFAIGGAYGFHPDLFVQANQKVALSKMTFTHQMCRLVFVEQLYRGLTILKGEKYHHD